MDERGGEICDMGMGGNGGQGREGGSEWREIHHVRGSVPEFRLAA